MGAPEERTTCAASGSHRTLCSTYGSWRSAVPRITPAMMVRWAPLGELRLPKESHCDVGQRADGDEVDLPRVLHDLPHDEVYCVLAVRLDRFILRF
jgi:hypothetical protein